MLSDVNDVPTFNAQYFFRKVNGKSVKERTRRSFEWRSNSLCSPPRDWSSWLSKVPPTFRCLQGMAHPARSVSCLGFLCLWRNFAFTIHITLFIFQPFPSYHQGALQVRKKILEFKHFIWCGVYWCDIKTIWRSSCHHGSSPPTNQTFQY